MGLKSVTSTCVHNILVPPIFVPIGFLLHVFSLSQAGEAFIDFAVVREPFKMLQLQTRLMVLHESAVSSSVSSAQCCDMTSRGATPGFSYLDSHCEVRAQRDPFKFPFNPCIFVGDKAPFMIQTGSERDLMCSASAEMLLIPCGGENVSA